MDLYEQARSFPLLVQHGRRVLTRQEAATATSWALARRIQRGRAFRPVHGTYLFGPDEPTFLESIRAALAVCPQGTALGFHTAAQLFGFGVVPSESVHVVVADGALFPQRRGITVHRSALPFVPVRVLGYPCTPAARCAVDLARAVTRLEAIAVLDAALYSRACVPPGLDAEVRRLKGFAGAVQARVLVPLASPLSQCRQESQLRLVLHDGGLTSFVPQHAVIVDGRRYFIDLADPQRKVGVEYDGSSHLDRARLRADRQRHNALEGLGWRMRYFTDHDLYRPQGPAAIVATVRAALTTR